MGFLKKALVTLALVAAPLVARVQPSDFSYLGSFDVTCGESWCTYGQRGLEIADGGSALWMTGHDYDAQVVKISIPPIGGTAQKLSGPTDFLNSCQEEDNWNFSGIEESGGVLRGTCSYWYNVTGSDLDNYHASQGAGAQHIGPRSDPFRSAKMGGYLFGVPPDFAAQHLGGRDLITGFHQSAGVNGGSQGPPLIAFDANDPASALDLSWYRENYPDCTWDGVNCDFPGYGPSDTWWGATWVRSAAGDAILVAGSNGLGPTRYGDGQAGDCSSYKGYHNDPYEAQILLYDPQDIVARLEGTKEPWEVLPYATMVLDGVGGWEECYEPGGMTYDQASGRLYLVHKDGAGYGQPKIHVWETGSGPPPPVCGDGNCDPGEDHVNCPADCPPPPVCGDGNCDAEEDPNNCPADCGPPPPVCGDGFCEVGEDCPVDCDPVCGDGICEEGEDCLEDCCPTCPSCDSCCPTPEPCDSCCPTPPACDSCCPTCPPLGTLLPTCDPVTQWTEGAAGELELKLTWDCP